MNKTDIYQSCGLPLICQSCGMPLIKDYLKTRLRDTVEDFCSFCVVDGVFCELEISAQQMQKKVKRKLLERGHSTHVINSSLSRIPRLKRWNESLNLKVPDEKENTFSNNKF
ncbi:MAG: zinc ribbon domain-containing protein [Cytophagaceae bacterium]